MHGGVGALALALAICAFNGVHGVWGVPFADTHRWKLVWLRTFG